MERCSITYAMSRVMAKRVGRNARVGFVRDLLEFAENIMYLCPKSLGRDRAESRWDHNGVFVGIMVESWELIIAIEKGVMTARSFRRKVDAERWNKEYLAKVRGVPWEPNPGSTDEYIRANPELAKETQFREPVVKGIYITRSDLRSDKYGLTPGCRGCIASNRGTSGIPHDDRFRRRIEDLSKEKEPERYERTLERICKN